MNNDLLQDESLSYLVGTLFDIVRQNPNSRFKYKKIIKDVTLKDPRCVNPRTRG